MPKLCVPDKRACKAARRHSLLCTCVGAIVNLFSWQYAPAGARAGHKRTAHAAIAKLGCALHVSVCACMHCRYKRGDRPPQPRRNIQNFWLIHCEDEWQRAFFMFSSSASPAALEPCPPSPPALLKGVQSTLSNVSIGRKGHAFFPDSLQRAPMLTVWGVMRLPGVLVFYVNLTLAAWIKFLSLAAAAILMTVVFCLGAAYFVVRPCMPCAMRSMGNRRHLSAACVVAWPTPVRENMIALVFFQCVFRCKTCGVSGCGAGRR